MLSFLLLRGANRHILSEDDTALLWANIPVFIHALGSRKYWSAILVSRQFLRFRGLLSIIRCRLMEDGGRLALGGVSAIESIVSHARAVLTQDLANGLRSRVCF